jgi:hypothetical protein
MSQVLTIDWASPSIGNQYILDQTRPHDRQIRSPEWCGYADSALRFGSQSGCGPSNPHFHMLYLNGVYDRNAAQPKATSGQSNRLLVRIWMSLPTRLPGASHGFWRKQVTWSAIGRPPRESEYLDLMQDEEDAMGAIVGASTDAPDRTYRLAFGPNAGLGAPDETADVTDSASENRAAQRRRPGKPAIRRRPPGFRCTPESPVNLISARSLSDSADTSLGLPLRSDDCHWRITVMSSLP